MDMTAIKLKKGKQPKDFNWNKYALLEELSNL